MRTIFDHVKDEGLDFSHVYKGHHTTTDDLGRSETTHTWDVSLVRPGQQHSTIPGLPCSAQWTYRASNGEGMEILEPTGDTGARFLGTDLLMFQSMWSALLVYERYLTTQDDFAEFLYRRGLRTAAFRTDNREPDPSSRIVTSAEEHWRREWAREKRLSRDLVMVVGESVLVHWLRNTKH